MDALRLYGKRYTDENEDEFHNDLSRAYTITMANAAKVRGFLDKHEDCDVCAFIRMGF